MTLSFWQRETEGVDADAKPEGPGGAGGREARRRLVPGGRGNSGG